MYKTACITMSWKRLAGNSQPKYTYDLLYEMLNMLKSSLVFTKLQCFYNAFEEHVEKKLLS